MSEGIPGFYNKRGAKWLEDSEGRDRTEKELRILARLFSAGSRILDAGCGYGRIAIPLVQSGFQVDAFDGSQKMLDSMQERMASESLGMNIYQDDLISPEKISGEYDGIILMWGTFANIPKDKQRSALETYSAHVVPGGKIVIELPEIDAQEYVPASKRNVEFLSRDENYGVELNVSEDEPNLVFAIPNTHGVQTLAEQTGLTVLSTNRFNATVNDIQQPRIIYVLTKQNK
ncbi:MAG: class I SAM-dependent methyltransferase [bacterium]|nr:class I SAM-dependent methyltransferase [bacterium]